MLRKTSPSEASCIAAGMTRASRVHTVGGPARHFDLFAIEAGASARQKSSRALVKYLNIEKVAEFDNMPCFPYE